MPALKSFSKFEMVDVLRPDNTDCLGISFILSSSSSSAEADYYAGIELTFEMFYFLSFEGEIFLKVGFVN